MHVIDLIEKHFWVTKIFIWLVIFFILQVILSKILKYIKRKYEKDEKHSKKRANEIFYNLICVIIWVFAGYIIFSIIGDKFDLQLFAFYVLKIRNLIIISMFFYAILEWKKILQDQILKKSKKSIDSHSMEFIGKIVNIILIFLFVLVILQVLGLNIMPIMAFSSIGAAAIGFAAKDVIANFFGGLMIYINRPFTTGDLIEIPSQNIIGHIENIGWYTTCIKELQKIPVYIPNNIFSNGIIKNKSRRTHRRLEETIKIRYDDFSKVVQIIDEVKNYILKSSDFDSSFDPYVFFTSYNDFSLDIMIRAYTNTVKERDFFEVRHKFLMHLNSIFEKCNVQVPFPITSIQFLNPLKDEK